MTGANLSEPPSPSENQVLIHAVLDYAPDVVWIHTHGMVRFGCPDLEWYWSPSHSWEDGAGILDRVARFFVARRPPVKAGEFASIDGTEMRLQFLESIPHPEHGFDGNSVWRLKEVATGKAAVDAFHRIIFSTPPTPAGADHALALHLEGRLDEASTEYRKLLDHNPGDVHALNNLGHLLSLLGKFSEAIELLQRALAIDASYALAHNNLGNALLQQGDAQGALASCRQAAVANPRYAMPHRNLALIHHLQGRLDDAIREMRTYFALAPAGVEDPDGHYNLGVMLAEKGNNEEALLQYQHAVAQRPRFAKALNNIGLLHFCASRVPDAIGFYRRAVEADPPFTLARFNLATALAAQGDAPGAIVEYRQVLAIEPEHLQAASNLGVLYTEQGQAEESLPIFQGLIARCPNSAVFRFNLALAYQAQSRREEAAEQFAKVLELEPGGSARAARANRELKALRQHEA